MASLPSIPGVDVLTDLARSQLHVMQQIPSVLTALNTTMIRLADAVQQSNETMASVQRVTNRMDRMLDELEEPVVMMGPGLRRLAVVLDDPILTAVPDMLRTMQQDLGPQLRQILEMQQSIQASALQVTAGLSDATKALTAIPGISRVSGLLAPRGASRSEEPAASGDSEAAAAAPPPKAEPAETPQPPAPKKPAAKRTTKASAAAKPKSTSASRAKSTSTRSSSGGSTTKPASKAKATPARTTPAKTKTAPEDEAPESTQN